MKVQGLIQLLLMEDANVRQLSSWMNRVTIAMTVLLQLSVVKAAVTAPPAKYAIRQQISLQLQ